MSDEEKAVLGLILGTFISVVIIAASVAIGIFFGVGWGVLAFAVMVFLHGVLFVLAVAKTSKAQSESAATSGMPLSRP